MNKVMISQEFFGGIIKNKNNWNNIAIDKFLFDFFSFMNSKSSYKEFYKKYAQELTVEEILEILEDCIKGKYLSTNYIIENNNTNENCLSAPLRVFYDITYLCNLKCKHCFTRSGHKNQNELTYDEKMELINQCDLLGVNRISIAGGEPFACKDLFLFIKECNKRNIGVSITTNGTLLNKKNIQIINDLKIKNLTVSIDGGTEESIDFVRGQGSYKKILEGLEKLKKYYKGNYSIKTTLMRNNISQLEDIINIAINSGCNSVKFNCVRADGRASDNADDIVLTSPEYIKTVKEIELLKIKYKDSIIVKGPLNIFSKEPYDFIKELGFGCFAGKESVCIDPLGNVRPCSHFPKEFVCGNIKKQSLSDIWKNSKILTSFRTLEGNEKCNKCNSYNKCGGGCRYRAYCNGNISGVDPYCYLGGSK